MIFQFEHAFKAGERDFTALDRAIADCLDDQAVPAPIAAQVMIAFDEIISNVLKYRGISGENCDGAQDDSPKLIIAIEFGDGEMLAEVADNGAEFDPLSSPEPDTNLPLEEREVGGLGVHIVRNLMENVAYSRENGWNRLRFSKTFGIE